MKSTKKLSTLLRRWRAKESTAMRQAGGKWSGSHSLTEAVVYANCADELQKIIRSIK